MNSNLGIVKRLFIPLIVVSILVQMAGCAGTAPKQTATMQNANQKKKAMDLFIEGKVAEAKENFSSAITSYMEALQYDPDSEDIALALAKAFVKERKLRSALYFSKMAVKQNPSNPNNWRLLQQLEQLDGRTDKAAEALKMYIKLNPEKNFHDVAWLARYYFDLEKEKEAKDLLMSVMKDKNSTAADMSEAANLLAEEGYIEEALSVYRRIVDRDPMDVQAWMTLGELYERNRRWEDARKTYRAGIEKNPDSVDLIVLLGNLCLIENDWNCAIAYFEKANATGIDVAKITKTLCALYFYADRENDALATLDKLKASDEDDALLYFSLGKAMHYLERYDEAAEYYQQGFDQPDETVEEETLFNAFRGYARTLVKLNRHEDAIELVRNIASTKINNRDGFKLLEASIYMDMQRYDDAIAIYEWLLASDPKSVRHLLLLGQAYSSSGQYEKAERTLIRVREIDPENVGYLIQLSLVYDLSGQFEKAENALSRVIKIEPENALALNNLAYMYIEHDTKISKAIEMVKQALELEPRNGAYYDTLGWGYYKQGKYEEAKKHIEEALKWEDTPDQGIIYDHYGDILGKLDMKKEASEAYQKAIELGEDEQKIQQKLDRL